MNENEYILLLDVWEGSLEIDEQVILENNVKGFLIRINDMNGGHHKDTEFDKQWNEAKNFIRIPYFVYNPWVNGLANANYLISILPQGVTTIAVDIEVRKDGYSPNTYAKEVDTCIKYWLSKGFTVLIYTGAWFINYLSYWPNYTEYWWARYPYLLYPNSPINITWDQLRELIKSLSWSPGCNKGPCSLWQCSGDRLILPGTLRTMDVNIFYGTEIGMIQKYKIPAIQQPQSGSPIDTGDGNEVQPITLIVQKACNVRNTPSTVGNIPSRTRSIGEIVTIDDIFVENWERLWVHDKEGWSAVLYDMTVFMK